MQLCRVPLPLAPPEGLYSLLVNRNNHSGPAGFWCAEIDGFTANYRSSEKSTACATGL